MNNTTIPELTELATLLSDDGAHVQAHLSCGDWYVTIYTRVIDHEHVRLLGGEPDDAAEHQFGIIRGESPNLHTAVNLAAAKARIVLASLGQEAAA